MEEKHKKKRGQNFTNNEKEVLVELVNRYADILENKKTDAVTSAAKAEGWMKLAIEFNSKSTFAYRTADQLKTCWENVKRTTRKDKASLKKQTFLTGGGKPDEPPHNSYSTKVESILGPSLEGISNVYDSDFTPFETNVIGEETVVEASTSTTNNWKEWNPSILKTPISEPLQEKKLWSSRRRPKIHEPDELTAAKLQLTELLIKTSQAESDKKMIILEEQIKQEKIKTELLNIDLKLKIKELEQKNVDL